MLQNWRQAIRREVRTAAGGAETWIETAWNDRGEDPREGVDERADERDRSPAGDR